MVGHNIFDWGIHHQNSHAEKIRFTPAERKRSSGDGEDVEASSHPKEKYKCGTTTMSSQQQARIRVVASAVM